MIRVAAPRAAEPTMPIYSHHYENEDWGPFLMSYPPERSPNVPCQPGHHNHIFEGQFVLRHRVQVGFPLLVDIQGYKSYQDLWGNRPINKWRLIKLRVSGDPVKVHIFLYVDE